MAALAQRNHENISCSNALIWAYNSHATVQAARGWAGVRRLGTGWRRQSTSTGA